MKTSLLIVSRQQFGYHIDTLYYCRYLRDRFDVTYIGWDYGRPRIELDGVRVLYIQRESSRWLRYLSFLTQARHAAKRHRGVVFLVYFPGCALVTPRAARTRAVLDIRTGSVSRNALVRTIADAMLRAEARMFKHVTIITSGLAARLRLRPDCVHVVPLGADVLCTADKSFERLRLLYVGTLHNRRIQDTLLGLRLFLDGEGAGVECRYSIVGSGYRSEVEDLRAMATRLGLESCVEIVGQVPHSELPRFFEEANVGVSYIPMTDYFDVQPPTKTFEYLLAGMAVVATATTENKKVIGDENGVLIEAAPASFAAGLAEIHRGRQRFSSAASRRSVSANQWNLIVDRNLAPYLMTVNGTGSEYTDYAS
jgi:glycosyltransferase involved in cell wall biosynthesis